MEGCQITAEELEDVLVQSPDDSAPLQAFQVSVAPIQHRLESLYCFVYNLDMSEEVVSGAKRSTSRYNEYTYFITMCKVNRCW